MNTETHNRLANCIWSIFNLLRGPYKRNEYHKANPIIELAVTGGAEVIVTKNIRDFRDMERRFPDLQSGARKHSSRSNNGHSDYPHAG